MPPLLVIPYRHSYREEAAAPSVVAGFSLPASLLPQAKARHHQNGTFQRDLEVPVTPLPATTDARALGRGGWS